MSAAQKHGWDARVGAALDELRNTIRARYPEATFEVARGDDEPSHVHLWTMVDLDDPDEVVDLVNDRVLELQLEDGLPVFVIPVRGPARVAAAAQS